MRPAYPHPLIAREGWFYLTLIIVAAISATLFFGWLLALPVWLIALFVLQFFRDPPRRLTDNSYAVVSPADGRVVAVERTTDPYTHQETLKISVFMNVFNVHSNRSPVDGQIQSIDYFAGSFLNAALAKASAENERNALVIRTNDGDLVTCVQIAGLIARRILCYVKPGEHLSRGQRYGFIRFGSRVDVYLPLKAQVKVALGDKVYATQTILAEL